MFNERWQKTQSDWQHELATSSISECLGMKNEPGHASGSRSKSRSKPQDHESDKQKRQRPHVAKNDDLRVVRWDFANIYTFFSEGPMGSVFFSEFSFFFFFPEYREYTTPPDHCWDDFEMMACGRAACDTAILVPYAAMMPWDGIL